MQLCSTNNRHTQEGRQLHMDGGSTGSVQQTEVRVNNGASPHASGLHEAVLHPMRCFNHRRRWGFVSAARWSIPQQEVELGAEFILAAILSVEKFRCYVEGMPFTIITDHAALKWLMSKRDLTGRLSRWSLRLQGFDFKIEHRKGSENV